MPDALSSISTRRTPQSEPAQADQVENSAGGYVFQIDPMARLRRFLTIGVTGGTYYVGEQKLAKETAAAVLMLIRANGPDMVREVVTISQAGRAPKQNPAIFTLAACAGLGDDETRKAALDALPLVCRTGTHLFLFAGYVEQFRGWGRGLRKAVAGWYSDRPEYDLAYQLVKYQSREGWSHRDLLRLSHPGSSDNVEPSRERSAVYEWVMGRENGREYLPQLVLAHLEAHLPGADVASVVRKHPGLSWEMLPSESLNERAVWEQLIENGLPQTALLRQLPRLTRLGLCDPMSQSAQTIAAQLTNPELLKRGRIHPISVLIAAKTYASGESVRGSSTWTPSRVIVDALDEAFYAAFGSVTPTGKRTLLAIDCSSSMTTPAGGLPISCREVAAALALVTAKTEALYETVGFTAGVDWRTAGASAWGDSVQLTPLNISPRQRLDDVIKVVERSDFGRTDCSLPMRWAQSTGRKFDTIVVITDNETWAGPVHPYQALREYREKSGISTRLAVLAITPTDFSIADPSDPGSIDISGFDSATPQILSDFSAGLV